MSRRDRLFEVGTATSSGGRKQRTGTRMKRVKNQPTVADVRRRSYTKAMKAIQKGTEEKSDEYRSTYLTAFALGFVFGDSVGPLFFFMTN